MIPLHCEQGSIEWRKARLGIPTASQASRLLTPKTLKPSSAQDKYLAELLAEWALGVPLDDAASGWLDRGIAMEEEARGWYAFEYGVEVEEVGLCMTDDGRFAGSPDGLVEAVGGLELKCPSAVVHMSYWLEPESLYDQYKLQVQTNLWVTGRDWWDLVSYNPELPKVVYRVEPDEAFVEAWEPVLNTFSMALEANKKRYVKEYGEPKSVELEYPLREANPQGGRFEYQDHESRLGT